jgi:hypothetical protein
MPASQWKLDGDDPADSPFIDDSINGLCDAIDNSSDHEIDGSDNLEHKDQTILPQKIAPTGGTVGQALLHQGTDVNPAWGNIPGLVSAMGTLDISSTGNKSKTGLGFQPSVILFIWGQTTSGWLSCLGIGFMKSTAQYSAEGNSDNANFNNRAHTGSMVGRGLNGSPIIFEFDYVSMDSDGFTVNVSDADSSTTVMWLALK